MKNFPGAFLANRRAVLITSLPVFFAAILIACYCLWPFVNDASKPELRVEGISGDGKYREPIPVMFFASDSGNALLSAGIEVDGNEVLKIDIAEITYHGGLNVDLSSLPEGPHRLAVWATDGSLRKNTARLETSFEVDRTPPEIETKTPRASVGQGDTAAIFVRASEALGLVSVSIDGRTFPGDCVDREKNIYRCLVPVSVFAGPARHTIGLKASDMAGNSVERALALAVFTHDFVREKIEVPQSKVEIFSDDQALRKEAEIISLALLTHTPDQLWSGPFTMPTVGRESSAYGSQRVYSTGLVASYHKGMDIANREWTFVRAANHGTVIVAARFILFGNMVIIDHGQGVITMYAHMTALAVQKGDYILKNEIIGFMGDTGLATGPHLHWELHVGTRDANPADWLGADFDNPWKEG